MDRTPHIPADRQLVQAYHEGGFKIAGALFEGSVLVRPERTTGWPVTGASELVGEHFAPLRDEGIDILVVGLGPEFLMFPPELRRELRAWGIVVEAMATPAACRTYNVLLAEERRVAAALIAMPAGTVGG